MSRKGNCWDNAPMESFWSTLKRECVTGVFNSRDEARAAIFDYVMTFYNRTRRHSTLNYMSPLQFEQHFSETTQLSVKTGDCQLSVKTGDCHYAQNAISACSISHYFCRRMDAMDND